MPFLFMCLIFSELPTSIFLFLFFFVLLPFSCANHSNRYFVLKIEGFEIISKMTYVFRRDSQQKTMNGYEKKPSNDEICLTEKFNNISNSFFDKYKMYVFCVTFKLFE